MLADAHCHFFSPGFLRALGREAKIEGDGADLVPNRIGWEPPQSDETLADRWVAELDRYSVARVMLIASIPGDESSVAAAVARHPTRIVGAFMVNPSAPDAAARVERAFSELGLSTACLFPAMHHLSLDDARVQAVFESAARHRRVVFVHCGVLSIGARKKLNLPCPFDLRLGDPLAVAATAVRYPTVPVIIPHFGAGMFREALMAAGSASNILLDTSSSNSWVGLHPGLTIRDVFARALDQVGPARLLFGSDSSFFPRGWHRAVYDAQRSLLADLGVVAEAQEAVFGGNFARVFAP